MLDWHPTITLVFNASINQIHRHKVTHKMHCNYLPSTLQSSNLYMQEGQGMGHQYLHGSIQVIYHPDMK